MAQETLLGCLFMLPPPPSNFITQYAIIGKICLTELYKEKMGGWKALVCGNSFSNIFSLGQFLLLLLLLITLVEAEIAFGFSKLPKDKLVKKIVKL